MYEGISVKRRGELTSRGKRLVAETDREKCYAEISFGSEISSARKKKERTGLF